MGAKTIMSGEKTGAAGPRVALMRWLRWTAAVTLLGAAQAAEWLRGQRATLH